MQDLANSLEDAIRQRVLAGGFPVNIYTGQGDYAKEHPSLVVYAESGEENPIDSGNFKVTIQCEFRYPADTEQLAAHRALCRDVLGELMTADLAARLSNADDLTVFGIFNRQMRSNIDENHWLSVLTFDCYCCILDIPVS